MKLIDTNSISKNELYELNEEDLMFITNPGRMGDEDGSTFIIKKDNVIVKYANNSLTVSTSK